MFIIEPLLWMFKTENFKNHFLKLLATGILFWLISLVIFLLAKNVVMDHNYIFYMALVVVAAVFYILPSLFLTGYFWCLTDNIIDREQLARANDIYNGRVDFYNKITLPEWSVRRFVWRGIASIVATIVMYIPFVVLSLFFLTNMATVMAFWNIDSSYVGIFVLIVFLTFFIIIPALLWNYARRDSVFAMLNLPKAVYIISSYPLKYFSNTVLFIVFAVINAFIINFIATTLGLAGTIMATSAHPTFSNINEFMGVPFIVFMILHYFISTYVIFVNAYLLGTIAPPSEY